MAASSALPLPAARPTPMWARPASFMIGGHVREVQVDEAGVADQVGDALHRLAQHVVRDLKGVAKGDLLVGGVLQALVGDDDQGVHLAPQLLNALLRLGHVRLPSKPKGLVTTPTVRMPAPGRSPPPRGLRRCRCRRPYRR